MKFWEILIIVAEAVSFAGFLVLVGIMLFTKRGQETLQKWEKEKEEKERLRRLGKKYRYLIAIYRYGIREKELVFLKYAKTEKEAIEKADRSIGKKEGYDVDVHCINTFTGKILDWVYKIGDEPPYYLKHEMAEERKNEEFVSLFETPPDDEQTEESDKE